MLSTTDLENSFRAQLCPVLRGVPNPEVDLNTALCGSDCRQCLNYRGVHYSECLSIIVTKSDTLWKL